VATCSLALLFLACTPRNTEVELEDAVSKFHALYNEQQFNKIYFQASRNYRRRMSWQEHERQLKEMFRRNGKAVSTKRDNKLQKDIFGGVVYMLTYTTQFERGQQTEFIGFSSTAREPGVLLLGYTRD
jgi:hypothetical protein